MKSSAKKYTFESAKVVNEEAQEKKKEENDSMYKVKWLLFLIVSAFLMYQAMVPSRKVPVKNKKKK